jgi:precorrin-3B synthase
VVDQLAAVGLVGPTPRRTIVSPLAGLDPTDHVDAAALATRVEAALQAVEGLSGKLAVAVDGGGLFPLVELNARIYLVALSSTAIALGVATAEGLRWCGATTPAAVPSALTGMLKLADAAGLAPVPQPPPRPPAVRAGVIRIAGVGAAVVLALPYGRCDVDQLIRIAGWAERFGDGEVRLSPWRGIVLPRVRRRDVAALIALASGAGLITDPGDPRLAILACPGRPDCASASVMTRRDAARLAVAARPLLEAGAQIHVSGCAKGCAHRGGPALTLLGDNGAYRVIVEGTPADTAIASLTIDEIAHRLASVETRAGLATRFSAPA